MPLLRIQTNITLDQQTRSELLSKASRRVAELLGKQEKYVMVSVQDGVSMLFSGSSAPQAFLELNSIGLPGDETGRFSAGLCDLIRDELGIDGNRVFLNFIDVARGMWGWNGTVL